MSVIALKIEKKALLSFEKCKEILNRNGNHYTNEEITQISDFLDILVEIDCRQFIKKDKNEKSDSLH